MGTDNRTIELLAPAGTPEKLEFAVHYGADAVYLAGKDFSLRNFAANFSREEMLAARQLTREKSVRMYVAVNVYARDAEADAIDDYLDFLHNLEPDALIVADPGIFMRARQHAPKIPLHVSTQANTTSTATARFWKTLGATRVNAARELRLDEVRQMCRRSGIEVETFVHGAMCMAYSGRCLLSTYLAGRDSNRGECCQPCRFRYTVMEETRPGQYFPIAEDNRGAYVFNARDLCMIEHLPALIETGTCALKIEGRMKSVHYLAGVVKVYREAIDAWFRDPRAYDLQPHWLAELTAISHRGYGTGFYFGDQRQTASSLDNLIVPGYRFVAQTIGPGTGGGAGVRVKNKIATGDRINILSPGLPAREDVIRMITDDDGTVQPIAQPGTTATIHTDTPLKRLDLIRRPEYNRSRELP